MAEALGIASAIISFYDIGEKFVKRGIELYKSVDGMADYHRHLKTVCNNFKIACAQIAAQGSTDPKLVPFSILSKEAEKIADRLLVLVEQCAFDPNGSRKKREFVKATFKGLMKDGKIKELEGQLDPMRQQMNNHLVVRNFLDQQEMHSIIRASRDEVKQELTRSHSTIMDALNKAMKDIEKGNHITNQQMKAILDKLQLQDAYMRVGPLLKSLKLPTMNGRLAEVVPALQGTYGWIFDPHVSPFLSWLETGSGVFWISGKPGSGKSTLMKLLSEHRSTIVALQKGDSQNVVLRSSYFFNSSDQDSERNIDRLLKCFLHDILNHLPLAIPDVLKFRARGHDPLWTDTFDWTTETLTGALQLILSRSQAKTKFLFFVDGLDEYRGGSRHDEVEWLLDELHAMSVHGNVKMCVASRPHDMIMSKLGTNRKRTFVMQQLTQGDMETYIDSRLKSQCFIDLRERDRSALLLYRDIRQRADGVFLWVKLVLNLLQNRGTNLGRRGNTVDQLREQLKNIPSELNDFYRYTFNSIDTNARDFSAQLFTLCLAAVKPLPVPMFECIDETLGGLDWATKTPRDISVATTEEAKIQCREQYWDKLLEISRQLSYHSGGLLEIKDNGSDNARSFATFKTSYTMDFIHRTARDFVEDDHKNSRGWVKPRGRLSTPMNLCSMYVGLCNSLGCDSVLPHQIGGSSFGDSAHEVLRYARRVEPRETTIADKLLHQMDIIGEHYTRAAKNKLNRADLDHWTVASRSWNDFDWTSGSLLTWSVNAGFNRLLDKALSSNGRDFPRNQLDALLDCSLRPVFNHGVGISRIQQFPIFPLVEKLLSMGANPNALLKQGRWKKRNVWTSFVDSLPSSPAPHQDHRSFTQWQSDVCKRVIMPMVRRGANLHVIIDEGLDCRLDDVWDPVMDTGEAGKLKFAKTAMARLNARGYMVSPEQTAATQQRRHLPIHTRPLTAQGLPDRPGVPSQASRSSQPSQSPFRAMVR